MTKNSYRYAGMDFTGQKFGRLTVIEKAEKGRSWWVCNCECGNQVILPTHRLLEYKSCGCLEKENKKNLGALNKRHGMTETRLYSVWCGIKERCFNSHYRYYHRYGGRGITVCPEWLNSFEAFRDWAYSSGYDESKTGKEQSLDRIDVDGNYEPGNCRWASQKEQMRNIGRSKYITSGDKTMVVSEFCEKHHITYPQFVTRRMQKGFTTDKILYEWNMIKNTPDDYMRIKEAATCYDVCTVSIMKWIRSGKLKAIKLGNTLLIPKGQIVERRSDRDKFGRFLPGEASKKS